MVSYRSCRWYDPYPRLAFAIELLRLASEETRNSVLIQLNAFLEQEFGVHGGQMPKSDSLSGVSERNNKGKRFYDSSESAKKTFELLKQSPPTLKMLAANKILDLMNAVTAAPPAA